MLGAMDFGAHLPLMDFGGHTFTLRHLMEYAEAAESLGFQALSVNDHMVFSVPWLDGLTALAAVMSRTQRIRLATTIALPVVRGPVPVAKTLAAIDLLSGGRLTVAVGPGSSPKDYAAVGIDFEERWKRLDEAILSLRALWKGNENPYRGRFYSTEGIALTPFPAQPGGPPLWIGSWGSEVGLRRTARLGDGWLASSYNTTPEAFAKGWRRLQELLREQGKDPSGFPNALATMWFHITDHRSEAERIFRERLLPAIQRPESDLRERLPVGPPETFAEKLDAFRKAGTQRVFIWPVVDEIRQIELFRERVAPLLAR